MVSDMASAAIARLAGLQDGQPGRPEGVASATNRLMKLIPSRDAFTVTDVTVAFFWARVERVEGSDCWAWRGGMNNDQPLMLVGGYPVSARKFGWLLLAGLVEPPKNRLFRTCAFTACVNPAHVDCALPAGRELRFLGRDATRAEIALVEDRPAAAESLDGIDVPPMLERMAAAQFDLPVTDRSKRPSDLGTNAATATAAAHEPIAFSRQPRAARVAHADPTPAPEPNLPVRRAYPTAEAMLEFILRPGVTCLTTPAGNTWVFGARIGKVEDPDAYAAVRRAMVIAGVWRVQG
jgi:hypothetical protein